MYHLCITPRRACLDPNLSHLEFRLLSLIATYADEDGWCFPSASTMAAELGTTRQSVSRALRNMQSADYITIEPRLRKNGSQASNGYYVTLDPKVAVHHDDAGGVHHDDAGGVHHDDAPIRTTYTEEKEKRPLAENIDGVGEYIKSDEGRTSLLAIWPEADLGELFEAWRDRVLSDPDQHDKPDMIAYFRGYVRNAKGKAPRSRAAPSPETHAELKGIEALCSDHLPDQYRAAWTAALETLAGQIGYATVRSWHGKCRLLEVENGRALIACPTRFVAMKIGTEYAGDFARALQAEGINRFAAIAEETAAA